MNSRAPNIYLFITRSSLTETHNPSHRLKFWLATLPLGDKWLDVYVAGYCFPMPWPGLRLTPLLQVGSRHLQASRSSVPRIAHVVLLVEWHFLSRAWWSLSDPEPSTSPPPCPWFPQIRCHANVEPLSSFFSLDRNLRCFLTLMRHRLRSSVPSGTTVFPSI